VDSSKNKQIVCPGQLYRHYAPRANLIVDCDADRESIGFIVGFSDREYPNSCQVIHMGTTKDPKSVAKNLYKVLRSLDRKGIKKAWVDMDFSSNGLWTTIAERLKKAAVDNTSNA